MRTAVLEQILQIRLF